MSRPAPHMQSLSLEFFPDWETGTLALRSNFLECDPGVLRTVALRGAHPPPLPEPCTALSMLRTLDLTIYPTEGHETFTAQELSAILAHSPIIETFGIQATSYLEDTGSEVIFTEVCPQLKRLAIDFYNASRLDSARGLACRFIGLKELAFSLSPDVSAPLHDLSNWAGPLQAYVPDHSDSILDFGTQKGTDLRVKVHTPLEDWEFLSSDRLVSLVIHEHIFAGQSPPPAPNLTDICIVLATRATIGENTHLCGVLQDSALVFDYPALRKLQFAHIPPVCSYTLEVTRSTTPTHLGTYDSNYRWTIALTDMIYFIRHRLLLQPPGRRLDALVLTGMRYIVDVDLAQSLLTLNTLVAHIEFEQSLPPHVLQNLSTPHLGV
ncbi:hypothetical protein EXIGLDRAFT_762585 [Exidia glandulosa HHB12029]|uniref:F-box domain-containing protein n=1 Tax=Exidia glandulosa HHB12029 TaxID=1314781 RepID=A0A165MMV6_EXIGL|nr:hypothetical protein EXIGLDRAFT_762585 [Exidia glandulosa HHB12029]